LFTAPTRARHPLHRSRAKEQFRETLERSGLAETVDAFYLETDEGMAAYRPGRANHTATPNGD
jgi:hypothetical protein